MFLSPVVCLHKQCDRAGGSAATSPNIANATQQANEKLPSVRLALQSSQVSACVCVHACTCGADVLLSGENGAIVVV